MSAANQDDDQSTRSRDALVAEMINGHATIKALALDLSLRPLWEEKHAENIEKASFVAVRPMAIPAWDQP